jgi:hypothetical protein
MPIPNNGLITETNRQYYEGAMSFLGDGINKVFTTTFDTNLVYGNYDQSSNEYNLNNFKIYTSPTGMPDSFTETNEAYSVVGNTITFVNAPANNTVIVVQLKRVDGGRYGNPQDPNSYAYGTAVEENYGGYAYITLDEVIDNFMIAYVGSGKLISSVKKTDVIFHAKRAMQEFSYDTLKSVKSQELTVPSNLSIPLPQDYVNYVKVSWIDNGGVKHPIYPTRLTSNPGSMPIQDDYGVAIQDDFDNNISGTSITEQRWKENNGTDLKTDIIEYYANGNNFYGLDYSRGFGRQYGLDPQIANFNGTFTINDREGKISFSSDLANINIIFEYISDGLAYDLDTRIPKMAEEAMYAYVLHAIISTRANQPEYIVNRLKQEKSAKLRNAKIRLSNIKLEEITQVLRGQSKWIKH